MALMRNQDMYNLIYNYYFAKSVVCSKLFVDTIPGITKDIKPENVIKV